MIPAFQSGAVTIYQGDSLEVLKQMEPETVNCVVTSPPYWALRDYGVEGQIGLETSPGEYLDRMVDVFREVRRVLRKDGTLWLNIGDNYAGSRKGGHNGYNSSTLHGSRNCHDESHKAQRSMTASRRRDDTPIPRSDVAVEGVKPKDLVGIPWMLAFALRTDGWYLRQDIIWHKPNPMPESTRDRCTKAHEYLFLLTKSSRYYFNQEAIRENVTGKAHARGTGINPKSRNWVSGWATGGVDHDSIANARPRHGSAAARKFRGNPEAKNVPGAMVNGMRPKQNDSFSAAVVGLVKKRNKRSVWTIASEPCPEAHFATFPKKLVRPCILAGCPPGGTVLDPFAGSGTTLQVAEEHQCKAIGIELSPEYIEIAERRLGQCSLPFAEAI